MLFNPRFSNKVMMNSLYGISGNDNYSLKGLFNMIRNFKNSFKMELGASHSSDSNDFMEDKNNIISIYPLSAFVNKDIDMNIFNHILTINRIDMLQYINERLLDEEIENPIFHIIVTKGKITQIENKFELPIKLYGVEDDIYAMFSIKEL